MRMPDIAFVATTVTVVTTSLSNVASERSNELGLRRLYCILTGDKNSAVYGGAGVALAHGSTYISKLLVISTSYLQPSKKWKSSILIITLVKQLSAN